MSSPRVIAITGATAGVGRATARLLAQKGHCLGLLARGPEKLEATATELEDLGGKALPLAVDIADPSAVERAVSDIERAFGPLDVWINNAMVTVFGPVDRLLPEELIRVTDVTYLGAVWGTLAALQVMRPRDRGVIIQVGSALAYRAIPLQAPYCAAKHAIRAFTDSVRCELIHDRSNVRITSVHLPALDTPQFTWGASHMQAQPQPVPPIYAPEVAAQAVAYAIDHERRELLVGWPTIKAVLGNKVAPGFLDRKLAHDAWEGQLVEGQPREFHDNNLFEPVEGDRGAHGIFVDRERQASLLEKTAVRMGAGGIQAALATGAALVLLITILIAAAIL